MRWQLFRVFVTVASLYCAVKSIYYANLAGLNFGVISCCFIFSIVINCTFGYFCFDEKITLRMLAGIAITLAGIIWISLAKGNRAVTPEFEDKVALERYLSITFALGSGTMNALTTVSGKFMRKNGGYVDVLKLSSDTGFFIAAVLIVLAAIFTATRHPACNMWNLMIGFFSACLNMLCGLVG